MRLILWIIVVMSFFFIDPSAVLDVVRWHGSYWSLNNRHLKALKICMSQIHPESLQRCFKARVRIWPLAPGLRLRHPCRGEVIDNFCDAYDTHDRGRTLRLRASSSSSESEADRHVRFVSAGTE